MMRGEKLQQLPVGGGTHKHTQRAVGVLQPKLKVRRNLARLEPVAGGLFKNKGR
jgi:hypothetical protein